VGVAMTAQAAEAPALLKAAAPAASKPAASAAKPAVRRTGPGTQTEDDSYVGVKNKPKKTRAAGGHDDDLSDLEVERKRKQ
jgi:hypothetical protein